MNVELSLTMVIEIMTFIGTVVAVWVNLNTKITKLESTVENHSAQIAKLELVYSEDLKEIKAMLHSLDKKMTHLETIQKLRDNENI